MPIWVQKASILAQNSDNPSLSVDRHQTAFYIELEVGYIWPLCWRGDNTRHSHWEARTSWVLCDKSLNDTSSLWSFLPNSRPWKMTLDDRYLLPKAVPNPHPRPSPIPQPPPLNQSFQHDGGFCIQTSHVLFLRTMKDQPNILLSSKTVLVIYLHRGPWNSMACL